MSIKQQIIEQLGYIKDTQVDELLEECGDLSVVIKTHYDRHNCALSNLKGMTKILKHKGIQSIQAFLTVDEYHKLEIEVKI
jgi:hypothetical protein